VNAAPPVPVAAGGLVMTGAAEAVMARVAAGELVALGETPLLTVTK